MKVVQVDIKKFRSIEHLSFEATPLTVLSGINSCGKSNVLRAIRFAMAESYSAARMARNIPHFINGPNAVTKVKLTFDEPLPALQRALQLQAGKPWTYEVDVKRNGSAFCRINGERVGDKERAAVLHEIRVVFVPPVRDIAGQGLDPFRILLHDSIKRKRGGLGVASASRALRTAIIRKGRDLLSSEQFPEIGRLSIDVDELDLASVLDKVQISVRGGAATSNLDSFGTGHQNQVVLALYRQLARASGKLVIFQFEEPDNHMHMTAMSGIASDLSECAEGVGQVFVATHSPALMNHFDLRTHVCLAKHGRKTVRRRYSPSMDDREYRVALSQFGLRPAETMTARRAVIVEGLTDVALVRALYRTVVGREIDRDDIVLVNAGGKEQAARLAALLHDLAVPHTCI